MAQEIKPVGETCNLRCRYCYEHETREGQTPGRYHREAILEACKKTPAFFHLFGGEALLLPIPELEEIFKIGLERFQHNGVQTNGTLITDEHIALFKKYRVNPGLSIDGPGDLNDVRWAGTLEATRRMTARSEAAIDRLLAAGIVPSLIVCLHRGNCETDEQLDRLIQWFRDLAAKGITHIMYHLMESNARCQDIRLPDDRMIVVLRRLWDLVAELPCLRQKTWDSILSAIRGDDRGVLCTFRPCDPLNTPACRGVEADGSPSNCGHVYKDKTVWMPAPDTGARWMRQVALYQTPQSEGGCQGCRFWLACYGHCPATGGAKDWRSRSEHCAVLTVMFEEAERRVLAAGFLAISQHPDRVKIEQQVLEHLKTASTRPCVYDILNPKPSSQPAPPAHQPGVGWPNHLDHLDVTRQR